MDKIRNIVPKLEEYSMQQDLTEEQSVWLKDVGKSLEKQILEEGKLICSHVEEDSKTISKSNVKLKEEEFNNNTIYLAAENRRFCCGNDFPEFLASSIEFFDTRSIYNPQEAAEYISQVFVKKIKEEVLRLEQSLGPESWAPSIRSYNEFGERCEESKSRISRIFEGMPDRFVHEVSNNKIELTGKDIVLLNGGDRPRKTFTSGSILKKADQIKWYNENKDKLPKQTLNDAYQTIVNRIEKINRFDCCTRLEVISHLLTKNGAKSVYFLNLNGDSECFNKISEVGTDKYSTKSLYLKDSR